MTALHAVLLGTVQGLTEILKLVQRSSLYPFVWYRLPAGAGAIIVVLLGR